jgi:hypothetical protein
MATPIVKITVRPSFDLIKAHYIEHGRIMAPFTTSILIDNMDFQNLNSAERSLVLAQFEDHGVLLDTASYQIVTNTHLISTQQIVRAFVELLARDEQAAVDRLALDWDRRVVQLAEDPNEDPGF